MKNKIKRTITVIALSLVAIVVSVLVLIVNGVIPVNPPQLQVLTDAGVTKYKSFAEGWEDSTEKYAFSATREQVATITQLQMHLGSPPQSGTFRKIGEDKREHTKHLGYPLAPPCHLQVNL